VSREHHGQETNRKRERSGAAKKSGRSLRKNKNEYNQLPRGLNGVAKVKSGGKLQVSGHRD